MQTRASTRAFARTIGSLALTGLLAYGIASIVRYGLIEREDLGPVCDAASAPWWCDARMLVIRAFLNDVFGWASVVCAAFALWRRSRGLAHLAVAVGTAGMVLYNFTWAGVGGIAGAMVLARLQANAMSATASTPGRNSHPGKSRWRPANTRPRST